MYFISSSLQPQLATAFGGSSLVGRHTLPAPLPTQATRAAGEGPAARSKTKSRRLETAKDGFSAVVDTHTVPTYVMLRDFLAFSDNT